MEFFIIFAFYYWRLTGFLQVGKDGKLNIAYSMLNIRIYRNTNI